MNAKLKSQDAKINQLETAVNETHHVEQGLVDCGSSKNWQVHGQQKWKSVTVSFSKVYSKPPVVDLSLRHVYSEKHLYFFILLDSVDATSFTARCVIPWDNPAYWDGTLHAMGVRWTSFPV